MQEAQSDQFSRELILKNLPLLADPTTLESEFERNRFNPAQVATFQTCFKAQDFHPSAY